MDALERLRGTGRNDDCPCGSGKKYKKCHLREDEDGASKALAESNAKIVAAAAEHKHGPDCDHDEDEGRMKPAAQNSSATLMAPKKTLSHKPMSTPRKAV